MLLSILKLNELRQLLQDRKRDPSKGCTKPLLINGKPTRRVDKPNATKKHGHVYPDGTVLKHNGSQKYIDVPNGTHGNDYLAIDAETLEIVCMKCKEEKSGS